MLAPKGAGLGWLAWARRPFLRSEMDQGAKALALVHQKPISQVCSCGTLAARFRQVRHKTQACRRNEPETWRAVGRKRCAMLRERAQKRAREQEESCCICKEIFGTSAAEKEKSTLFEGADRHR